MTDGNPNPSTQAAIRTTVSPGDDLRRGEAGNKSAVSNEVQFALVISRMLDTVNNHPEHMRRVVYDLARYKLQEQFTHTDVKEMNQAMQALETAIRGVEEFSQQQSQLSAPLMETPETPDAESLPPARLATGGKLRPNPPLHPRPQIEIERTPAPVKAKAETMPRHPLWSVMGRAAALLLCVGIIAFAFQNRERLAKVGGQLSSRERQPAAPVAAPSLATAPAAAVQPQPNPPRPTDFGVYAVVDDKSLAELHLLPGRPPDIRVAMSAAFKIPQQDSLPNGHPKFIVFRRDAVNNVQERAEVRVIAKISREFSAETAGKKPDTEDAWVIRNVAYPFRASPIADNPEMYELHSEDAGLDLPPGDYALVLKAQAYYFRIAGNVLDPRQCIERIVTTTGTFYADCRKS